MKPQSLGQLLATTQELTSLRADAQRATKLQQFYVSRVPPELANLSRVAGVRGGAVRIVTANPVTAAKLKQMLPRLLTAIQECDREVTALQVRVQPTTRYERLATPSQKKPLSIESIEYFRALSTQVSDDSPLKIALTNLVRHHGGDA